MLLQLTTDHRFEGFILAAIVVNSVLMVLEDYKDPGKLNGNPNIRNQVVSGLHGQRCPPFLAPRPSMEANGVALVW